MAVLIDTFVASSVYNSLPHIQVASDAPEQHKDDLEDLRALLVKYDVPKDVSIRLIHKHYDTLDREVMVFDKVEHPTHGTVQTMKPVIPSAASGLHGIHYFLNDQGALQAYEYATCEAPDPTSVPGPFFAEFRRMVSERGLQHKFGLKIKRADELAQTGWTEYELHEKRSTVMFPDGMPQPEKGAPKVSGAASAFTVTTEWLGGPGQSDSPGSACSHSQCRHCSHPPPTVICVAHWPDPWEKGVQDGMMDKQRVFCLGGQKVEAGTPVYEILSAVVEAL